MFVELLAASLIGYLLGSIPFALVIGKVFYNTDIRNYGSKKHLCRSQVHRQVRNRKNAVGNHR